MLIWLAWLYLILLLLVGGLWLVLCLSPSLRSNLQHHLPPEPSEDDTPAAPAGALPPVALLCPGRNEAAHLPTVLPELCGQDYPGALPAGALPGAALPGAALPGAGSLSGLRVVFIDDESNDATPQITAEMADRHANLLAVRNNDDPPAGWVGKCWAMHQGYAALRAVEHETANDRSAQWVCFTDADIHWDRRCLRRAMDHALAHDADVVALLPHMVFGSAIEAIVQVQLALALCILFPMDKAMDPDHPDTLTGGAFMLVRRSLYDRIGGHAAVKGLVVEDINLGRALKAAGGRIRVARAPELLWCRMYDGVGDMWEGLTKNAFAGMEYSWLRLAWLCTGVMLANVLPPVYVLASAAWLAWSPGWMSGLALGLSGAIVLLTARVVGAVSRALDLPWGYAWSMPIGSALYLGIIAGSVWAYCRGGNVWKGRSYSKPAG